MMYVVFSSYTPTVFTCLGNLMTVIYVVCYLQKVAESTNRSAKLLEQRTTDAALSALEIVSEALSISEYSEKLLEMKAEALCLVCLLEHISLDLFI